MYNQRKRKQPAITGIFMWLELFRCAIILFVKGAGILGLFYPFVKQGMRNIAFMADITPAFPGTIQINELLLECICIFTGVPFLLCFCQPYF